MKTRITSVFLFLALFFTATYNSSYSQCDGGLTAVQVLSFANGQTVGFTDPLTSGPYSGYAGTVNSTMDSHPMPVYCVDLHRNVSLGDASYTDTCAYVQSRIQYILNNYFPYKTSYPDKLADNNQEAASVQMAIWKYTDNVDANTITDGTIKTRALAIIQDADNNGNAALPIITFTIEASMSPDYFYVKTVDENGAGIAVSNISLSISAGSLSVNTVSTNASGISPDVEVLNTLTGTITATASMLFSQGRILHSTTLNKQSLTIAYPVYGMMETTSDWGALPVELSAFNATVNGRNVELNWTTSSEINNSGFNIERKLIGVSEWNTIGNVVGNGTSNNQHSYSFTDRNIVNGKYSYRLKQIDFNGNYEYHNLNSEVELGAPTKFSLYQNYPNPFNPTTKINYDLVNDGNVSLKIYNMSGKEIATLVNGFNASGYHSVTFDATGISSGIYYYKLEANGISKVMKMALIK